MNERVRVVRKAMKLNQNEFSKKLGITPTAISRIERGERRITDRLIMSICREFGINEQWLRTGDGEMLDLTRDGAIKQLVKKYELSSKDQRILEIYFSLPESYQNTFMDFIDKFIEAYNNYNNDGETFTYPKLNKKINDVDKFEI